MKWMSNESNVVNGMKKSILDGKLILMYLCGYFSTILLLWAMMGGNE